MSFRIQHCLRGLSTLLAVFAAAWVQVGVVATDASASERRVVVNRVRVNAASLASLERSYGVRVADGRYWYDAFSGLWGSEGGPPRGWIAAGLALGGRLQADASGSHTPVAINGRWIHPEELRYLEGLFGRVIPGRYWLDEHGIGGYEGGPASFDLRAQASSHRSSVLGHSDTGSVLGDDGIVGYIGGSTGVTCAPDGGCIY